MGMNGIPTCIVVYVYIYVCVVCVSLGPVGLRGCQIPWNWSYDGCELPCRGWELNLIHLEEQQKEPPLQPGVWYFIMTVLTANHRL